MSVDDCRFSNVRKLRRDRDYSDSRACDTEGDRVEASRVIGRDDCFSERNLTVGSAVCRVQLFNVVSRTKPAVVNVGLGGHHERRTDVGDGDTDRLRTAQSAIRGFDDDIVNIVAIEISRNVKVRSGNKSQYARDYINRELCRVRSTNNAIHNRLHWQIGVGCGDSCDGGCVFRNADTARGPTAVTGDDRSIVIDRSDRKTHQNAAVRSNSVID